MSPPLESGPRQDAATGADYLARVRALAPLIAASIEATEQGRRLAPPLVAAMKEADLFRILLPRPFGGAELDPMSFVRVIEAVAMIDGSPAWVLCQTAVTAMVAARLEPEFAWEIWRDPQAVLAWGPGPTSRAVVVEGGYRVTGSWAFASGCWQATWLGGDCTVCAPDGTPRRTADGKPETRRLLFPRSQATMRDLWQVIGLRGTGSDGYTVADLFVPAGLSVAGIDNRAERHYSGALYELSAYSMFACGFAALAVGIVRSLLDSYIALAREKIPRGYKTALQQDGVTQAEIGFAEARLRSARMYLMGTLGEVWDAVQQTGKITLDQRMAIRLAATFAIRQAKEVADAAFDAAGTTAVFNSNAFERRFRDIHTVAQQLQGRKSHFTTVGQYLLGLDTELGWI